MKVKVSIEFTYGKQMSKDIEEFAKVFNVPAEDVARIGVQNLLNECYECADDENYAVSAELLED